MQKTPWLCISESYQDKYDISVGDEITLHEEYENKEYVFEVASIFEQSQTLAIFMSLDTFEECFGWGEGEFTGYLSNTEITDIDENDIATVITVSTFTKMATQLDHSMEAYMVYFQYLCILISAILIYLLTKIIVEKNEVSISMTKILGYTNREVASLYLHSTTIVVLIFICISTFHVTRIMDLLWREMLMSYQGWFHFMMNPVDYCKISGL